MVGFIREMANFVRKTSEQNGNIYLEIENVCFQFRLYDSNLMFTADSYTYQCQYLYNCAPTPPLTQKQSTDSKLGFMLA